ncbi:MAG TPA: nitrate/nitrite transporter NrtS, partial [Thermoanaerobaculia bacterium]|nr:nitrate/nitrite transporter NrtS [Thermoanaerobaculia bacterium]
MKEWLRDAFEASVRKRALRMAAIVGSILLAINHGDAILHGGIGRDRWLRMILTLLVPYIVSTVSSVGAVRE